VVNVQLHTNDSAPFYAIKQFRFVLNVISSSYMFYGFRISNGVGLYAKMAYSRYGHKIQRPRDNINDRKPSSALLVAHEKRRVSPTSVAAKLDAIRLCVELESEFASEAGHLEQLERSMVSAIVSLH